MAEVASSNACFDSLNRNFNSSVLPASVWKVCTTPDPAVPKEDNTEDICIWSILLKASTNIIIPSVEERLRASVNSCTSMPAALANLAGLAYIFVMTPCIAVEPFSIVTLLESRTAPNASISSIVIWDWFATAPMREANSTRFGAPAAHFCDNVFTAEPTESIAFSVPISLSRLKMPASFEIISGASAPSSSIATPMISPARTNPITSSTEFLPRRPAD